TIRNSNDFFDRYLYTLTQQDSLDVNKINDTLIHAYSFSGLAVYYNSDSLLVINEQARSYSKRSYDYIARAMAADSSMGTVLSVNKKRIYEYIRLVRREGRPSVAVVFYSDAEYIHNIVQNIWFQNFLRWFIQALIIAAVTLFVIRWGIFGPINRIVEWIKAA